MTVSAHLDAFARNNLPNCSTAGSGRGAATGRA